MTGVAILLLVKTGEQESIKGEIRYFNIGDGLSKNDKINKLSILESIEGITEFDVIVPNEKYDWINQRNSDFNSLIKLGDKKSNEALFLDYTGGIKTGRDAWTSNFSKNTVINSMKESIKYYQTNLGDVGVYEKGTNKISWTRSLKEKFEKRQPLQFDESRIYVGMYRPFTKKYIYYDSNWTDRQYKMKYVFPENSSKNTLISISNKTEGKIMTCLAINVLPDVNLFAGGSQNLPMYLFDNLGSYSSIRERVLENFKGLKPDQVLPYIYAIFHSKEYRKKYHQDLSKEFPRVPNLKNKNEIIKIGRDLMELHINYEEVPVYDGVNIEVSHNPSYKVTKMKYAKKRDKEGKSGNDLSTIIFNKDIKISNIPEKAYEYIVNGRSAIEWIMDQYQVKTDNKSGITDDPNDYSDDEKYIFNLLLRIINVSVQTVDIINSLPKFEVED